MAISYTNEMPLDTFWDDTPIFFYSCVFQHLWHIKNASICTSVICLHFMYFKVIYFGFSSLSIVESRAYLLVGVHGLHAAVASLLMERGL